MSRIFATIMLGLGLWMAAVPAVAQGFSGLARVEMEASGLRDTRRGLELRLALSQGVPYRVYTLEAPARLVLDFREVDWNGLDKAGLMAGATVPDVRFGAFRPGWSRMVVDLGAPMVLSRAEMALDRASGRAVLTVALDRAEAEDFAARSGAPYDPDWALPEVTVLPPEARAKPGEGPLVVVLDPGHGGIDPGAEREGETEKQLMLRFAQELKEVLLRAGGFEVVMTREDDSFVALERRVALAHQAGGQVFISLHADALAEGLAHGAVVHLLSKTATDAASAKLAETHDRADILSGVDLSGKDDVVADILLDLARLETQPRAETLARALVTAMKQAGGPVNRKPIRRAGFSVLKAADIPSVLLEVGFLSSPRDLKNLRSAEWRARLAAGIRDGLQAWRIEDAATAGLVRQ